MILGHQHLCYHWVMNPLTNLVANEFCIVFIGRARQHHISKISQPLTEAWLIPQFFVLFQSLFWRDRHSRPLIEFMHERASRFVTYPEYLRIPRLDLLHSLFIDRTVTQRCAVVGCALEDGQMRDLWSNHGNQLYRSGSGAYHANSLSIQVHALFWPPAGVGPSASKVINAFKIGHVASGENTHSGD